MGNLKENSKKDIIGIISVINVIALLAISFSGGSLKFLFASICIFVVLDFIIIPFKKEKAKKLEDKNIIRKAIIKSVVSFIFLICLYRVFITDNYNLKYTYYIIVICLLLILTSFCYKSIMDRYKKDKKQGRKTFNLSFIFNLVFNIGLLLALIYFIFGFTSVPKESIDFLNIEEPEYISMDKITKDYFKDIKEFDFDKNEVTIDSTKAIESIKKDLQGKKIENISGIDLLNYEKMISDYKSQYLLQFIYEEDEGVDIGRLEDGHIGFIRITSNGQAFIEEINPKSSSIFNNYSRILYYPIQLSKETIDDILSYVE